MIRIAIVEDEASYARQLCGYLEQYAREKQCEMKVTCFSGGDEITARYRPEYDIILLDIDMPFLDGLSTARLIREQDQEVVLIFVTNLAQYAISGYAVDALDYILKPVSYFSFSQYLTRAISRIKRRTEEYLSVSSKGSIYKIGISSICYAEIQDHSLMICTKEKTYRAAGKMRDIEEKLKPYHFFRCHASYLINLEYVQGFQRGFVIVCEKEIPVSRSKKKEFLQVMADYMNGV